MKADKTGLVLEGGGFRGIYGAGPVDYFIEKNIEFPYMIGVSMGSCNGANYLSKQVGRNLQIPYTYVNDKRYMSYRRLITKGELFGMDFIFNEVPHKLIPWDFETLRKCKTKFVIVTTDCETGKPFYVDDFKKYDILEAFKASTSLPFASKMVNLAGRKLLDGGISDSIPYRKALEDGCKKMVIVLTQPKNYRKNPSSSAKLAKIMYRKYPKLIEAITHRHEIYNRTLDEIEVLEKKGIAFVIRPETTLPLKRIERNKEMLKHVFDIGYNQIASYEADLMKFLKKSVNS